MRPSSSCAKKGDVRYEQLVSRGHSRWTGSPEEIHLPGSPQEVAAAVADAVGAQRRVAVRGGGHCAEDFVDSPEVAALIDLSRMRRVTFDPELDAFSVEGGATLEDLYRELFLGWGVTVPAGWCPSVGVGGHIAGGGYGVLSRALGLAADYLHAVEVVTVGADGRVAVVVATCAPSDPHRDLWWAHTGGGGGTFGVATRYWLRGRDAAGAPPEGLLPRAPGRMLDFVCEWPWAGMDQARFTRLVRNHAGWCTNNATSGGANDRVYCDLLLGDPGTAPVRMVGQAHGDGAEALVEALVSEVAAGVGRPDHLAVTWMPYLASTWRGQGGGDGNRFKLKSAYRREPLGDGQVAGIFRHLLLAPSAGLCVLVRRKSYGGRINDVAPDATATATRDAAMSLTYVAEWPRAADDAVNDERIRRLYGEVYRRSGGVPEAADGAYIGYADTDLADPSHNHGAPWHELYFKHNYARLQQVKRRYDPDDVFRHGLSVRPQ